MWTAIITLSLILENKDKRKKQWISSIQEKEMKDEAF